MKKLFIKFINHPWAQTWYGLIMLLLFSVMYIFTCCKIDLFFAGMWLGWGIVSAMNAYYGKKIIDNKNEIIKILMKADSHRCDMIRCLEKLSYLQRTQIDELQKEIKSLKNENQN